MVEGLYFQKIGAKQFYLVQLGLSTTNLRKTNLKSATYLDAETLKTIGWVRLSPKQMVLWDG